MDDEWVIVNQLMIQAHDIVYPSFKTSVLRAFFVTGMNIFLQLVMIPVMASPDENTEIFSFNCFYLGSSLITYFFFHSRFLAVFVVITSISFGAIFLISLYAKAYRICSVVDSASFFLTFYTGLGFKYCLDNQAYFGADVDLEFIIIYASMVAKLISAAEKYERIKLEVVLRESNIFVFGYHVAGYIGHLAWTEFFDHVDIFKRRPKLNLKWWTVVIKLIQRSFLYCMLSYEFIHFELIGHIIPFKTINLFFFHAFQIRCKYYYLMALGNLAAVASGMRKKRSCSTKWMFNVLPAECSVSLSDYFTLANIPVSYMIRRLFPVHHFRKLLWHGSLLMITVSCFDIKYAILLALFITSVYTESLVAAKLRQNVDHAPTLRFLNQFRLTMPILNFPGASYILSVISTALAIVVDLFVFGAFYEIQNNINSFLEEVE